MHGDKNPPAMLRSWGTRVRTQVSTVCYLELRLSTFAAAQAYSSCGSTSGNTRCTKFAYTRVRSFNDIPFRAPFAITLLQQPCSPSAEGWYLNTLHNTGILVRHRHHGVS